MEPIIEEREPFKKRTNSVKISVAGEDEKRLMTECVALFLKAHPELTGMRFTRRFMFRKVLDFYLK